MLPNDEIDVSVYASSPQLDVPSLIALGHQLLAAAPANLPPPAEVCKKQLLTMTRILETGYQATQDDGSDVPKRPIDLGTDGSWAGFKSRLEPYTWLDEDRFPVAVRAKYLVRRLLPTGLAFTQLEYGAQWAEANWRIKVITEEKLEPELRELCGDLFIDELFYWHKKYGKMVGAVAPRKGAEEPSKPRPNLADLRRQAAQAVVAWQVQLVALHLGGHPGARAGLRPSDVYRDKVAAATSRGSAEPKAPEVPGPTPGTQPGATPDAPKAAGTDSAG